MKLDFDLGNTRLKWHLQSESISEYGAAAWYDLGVSGDSLRQLQALIEKHNPDGIEALEVSVASVASPKLETLFNSWLQEKFSLQAHYIQVEQNLAGLRLAYEDISTLGVDRWLAMLAAARQSEGFRIVIDAGSAITVDYLDPEGRHIGGLIVPGIPLIRAAMSEGTRNLQLESLTLTQNWRPGCDTVAGIREGASAMYQGLVNQALAYYKGRAKALEEKLMVVLSGGDAAVLAPWCEQQLEFGQFTSNEFLVLDGIEAWREYRRKYRHNSTQTQS